jgi:hypothetical protein
MAIEDDRIHVGFDADTFSVSMTFGDMVVSMSMPTTSGLTEMPMDQARTHVLRQARRVFEIASQELAGH